MNKLFFWNEWKPGFRYLYLSLLGLFFLTAFAYLFFWIADFKFILDWNTIAEFDNVKLELDNFSKGLLEYSVDAEAYLAKESFIGGLLNLNPWFSYVYFFIILLCIAFSLTIITRANLLWFAVGAAFFIFFIINWHTEALEIFGWQNRKFSLLLILVFVGIAFYLQAYDQKTNFFQRLLIFSVLIIAAVICIVYTSPASYPILHLANYSIVIPIVLTVIFIFSVAYDIINGFVYITGSAKAGGKNSIFHFIVISLLYLANLFVIYLKKKGNISGDFIHFNIFIIFLASAILGIWQHRKRKFIYENILTTSLASFLYITVAIISITTIAYSFATGNDALILCFEYAILYSHLGIGLLFFLYVIYNFGELFSKNISVYYNVYAPRRFPFFMVRPIGIIIAIALFFQSGRYPYRLAQSGYYNFVGDIYYQQEDFEEAQKAYKEGSIYARLNKRSNFSMASTLLLTGKKHDAVFYYKNTLERYPTEYAYINLSNIYSETDNFFYALFQLKEGLQKYPESGKIHNNLGILYGSKGVWDSSFYHLNKAKQILKDDAVPSTNLLWFLTRKNLLSETDSLINKSYDDYITFVTNKLVESKISNKKDNVLNVSFLEDSILNGSTYAYINNYTLQKIGLKDSTLLNSITRFTSYEGNDSYYHELTFLKTLQLYYSGNRYQAISELKNLTSSSSPSSANYFNRILGFWAMQNEAPLEAVEYFHNSIDYLNAESQFNKALALLESGKNKEAFEILTPLSKNPQSGFSEISTTLLSFYQVSNPDLILKENEEKRVQYLHFKKNSLNETQVLNIYNSITDNIIKSYAAEEVMEYYNNRLLYEQSIKIYSSLEDQYKVRSNYQYLKSLEGLKRWDDLIKETERLNLVEGKELYANYLKGVAYFNKNELKQAEVYLTKAVNESPLNPMSYIYLSEVLNRSNETSQAYDVLLMGINMNPNSAELQKKYALQALRINLTNYGDLALETLKGLLSPGEYSSFSQQYRQEKERIEKEFNQF